MPIKKIKIEFPLGHYLGEPLLYSIFIMKNINRYTTDTSLIKDAMHWPLTNLDNEYAKQRNRKITHERRPVAKRKATGRLGDFISWGVISLRHRDLVIG